MGAWQLGAGIAHCLTVSRELGVDRGQLAIGWGVGHWELGSWERASRTVSPSTVNRELTEGSEQVGELVIGSLAVGSLYHAPSHRQP